MFSKLINKRVDVNVKYNLYTLKWGVFFDKLRRYKKKLTVDIRKQVKLYILAHGGNPNIIDENGNTGLMIGKIFLSLLFINICLNILFNPYVFFYHIIDYYYTKKIIPYYRLRII